MNKYFITVARVEKDLLSPESFYSNFSFRLRGEQLGVLDMLSVI